VSPAARLLVAHGVAYPVAIAWAFGAVPVLILRIAARGGPLLDDATVGQRVVVHDAWPALGAFVAVHVLGAVWAFSRDATKGRKVFVVSTAALTAVAVVGGGASWLWLLSR
jgi:hypothetical protein